MSKKKIPTTVMEKEEPLIEPQFQIVGMEARQFSLEPPTEELPQGYRFDLQLEQADTLKDNIVMAQVNLTIKSEAELILGKLTMGFLFQVMNFQEIKAHKPSALYLSQKLNQIAVSTTRGAVFGIFRGTILQNVIIPIVDVQPKEIT